MMATRTRIAFVERDGFETGRAALTHVARCACEVRAPRTPKGTFLAPWPSPKVPVDGSSRRASTCWSDALTAYWGTPGGVAPPSTWRTSTASDSRTEVP